MCLSSVYQKQATDNNLLLSNVQRIECRDGVVVLTDIMEREMTIEGEIQLMDLIANRIVIAPKEN